MKTKLAHILTFLAFSASAGETPHNAWRELDPDVRDALQLKLRPFNDHPFWDVSEPGPDGSGFPGAFRAWYSKYYCPAAADTNSGEGPWEGCKDAMRVYPEYRYNSLSQPRRVSAACVTEKLLREFPALFPHEMPALGSIAWIGMHDELTFYVAGKTQEEQRLNDATLVELLGTITRGDGSPAYTTSNGADWGKSWGLRDSRVGAYLHISREKELPSGHINIHIDILNPGNASGIDLLYHLSWDYEDRETNYTAAAMAKASPTRCGLGRHELAALGLLRHRLWNN